MNRVDISECPYGYKNSNRCNLYEDNCNNYPDCDYRELQKYKQENKTLKQKIEKLKQECKQAPTLDTELSLRLLEILDDKG